ncbi:MAG: hypothetical protein LUD18_11630, partial [Lachnospiraceae bacterium]|nr:hypothetical protein [Lachnospiraceae bacterium]
MSRKIIVAELTALLFACAFLCIYLYYSQASVKKVDVSGCDTDSRIIFYLDGIEEGNCISIHGWAFKESENTGYFDTRILLKNLSTGDYYGISTTFQIRDDVTEVYGGGEYT